LRHATTLASSRSGDFDFADVRNYPPVDFFGIVVLRLPPGATAQMILRQIEGFLRLEDVLSVLTGRLAIVEVNRVRLRPRR
jgi:hypothetical protein